MLTICSIVFTSFFLTACTPSALPTQTPVPIEPSDMTVSKTFDPSATEEPFPTDNLVTISGMADCMPFKNTEGGQMAMCGLGIKTEDNVYYGIRLSEQDQNKFQAGKQLKVQGYLKTETDSIYTTQGTIKVIKVF